MHVRIPLPQGPFPHYGSAMTRTLGSDTLDSVENTQPKGVGVDIGGTTMTIARVLPGGKLEGELTVPSPARISGDAVVEAISSYVRTHCPTASFLGVGTAGVVEPEEGRILAASDSFRGWAGFPLRARLEAELSIPVRVANDVNAFLVGEQQHGAGVGARDCLGVMLGTGVGGAVILGGELFAGMRGAAAEIGHMPLMGDEPCTCGSTGHLESYASGRSLGRRFAHAVGEDRQERREPASGGNALPSGRDALPSGRDALPSGRDVAAAAAEGHPAAARVLHEAGEALGLALVQAATLFDLDTVILGGSVLGAWSWIEPGVQQIFARYPLISGATISLRQAELGANAVLLGAAALAKQAHTDFSVGGADSDTAQGKGVLE